MFSSECHVDILHSWPGTNIPGGFSVLPWFNCEIQARVICYTLNRIKSDCMYFITKISQKLKRLYVSCSDIQEADWKAD